NDRAGYSLSLGLGGGSSAVSCTGCGTDRTSGASGYLRLGKGYTPSLMLGLELNGWNKTENNVDGRVGMLSAIAQWYPSMTNGFFFKGGAGMGRTTLDDKSAVPSNKLQSTGFGYQVGTGYDIGIARRWSITPYVNYLATAGAKLEMNGVSSSEKFDGNYFQYGLGLSWH
ncbi:MAG TPA: autotransporter domain-containing protein, partial [Gemmatimonadaceae bacterium]|nr:autotransporter domain-containing protein [Gemmatimonadaceae bacterium]